MDLKAPLPEEFERNRRAAMECAEARKEPPMDTDNMLMQPSEDWEKSDRDGTCGTDRRLFFSPSERYKERYDAIDWGVEV